MWQSHHNLPLRRSVPVSSKSPSSMTRSLRGSGSFWSQLYGWYQHSHKKQTAIPSFNVIHCAVHSIPHEIVYKTTWKSSHTFKDCACSRWVHLFITHWRVLCFFMIYKILFKISASQCTFLGFIRYHTIQYHTFQCSRFFVGRHSTIQAQHYHGTE